MTALTIRKLRWQGKARPTGGESTGDRNERRGSSNRFSAQRPAQRGEPRYAIITPKRRALSLAATPGHNRWSRSRLRAVEAAFKPPDEPSDGPLVPVAGDETETNGMKTTSTAVRNSALSLQSRDAAHSLHPTKRNWESPAASVKPRRLGEVRVNEFAYRGRWKGWKGSNYQPLYTSYVRVEDKFRATYISGFSGALTERKLRAPSGTEWDKDGSIVLSSDYRVEYHPTSDDMLARDFGRRVLVALRSARDKRAEADRATREQHQLRAIAPTCIVTLQDSRRAGNCDRGTLQFAERLGIRAESALAGPWMVGLPSALILRTHNPATERACLCAAQRETLVSI